MLNMYAHMWWDFVTNGWSVFDFAVVLVSSQHPDDSAECRRRESPGRERGEEGVHTDWVHKEGRLDEGATPRVYSCAAAAR